VRRLAALAAATLLAAPAHAAPFDVLDAVRDGVDAVDGLDGARAVATSPDGKHVYVASVADAAVAAFAVDAAGALTQVDIERDGQNGAEGIAAPVDVAVSPDGLHVYVAGFSSDAIGIFSRDAGTGALAFASAVFDASLATSGLDGASGVALSPDGRHLYATAGVGDTVAAFARDAGTGALTLVEVETNVPPRLLDDPADLGISPDGALVYVVSQGFTSNVAADALITFARDAVTGALTEIDAEQDQVAGVAGLELPNAVAASPDGRHVYTTAGLADAIAFFGRSTADDTTSFIGLVSDLAQGVDGLDGAVGLAISPDGRHVLATSVSDDALAVFERDANTGLLAFERAVRDDAAPAERMLADAIDVAISPDGRFVFVAALGDDALTVFAPEPRAALLATAACAALALLRGRARR
jgi:6-phosphogluconolactonase (cycloisomerase 2 family)